MVSGRSLLALFALSAPASAFRQGQSGRRWVIRSVCGQRRWAAAAATGAYQQELEAALRVVDAASSAALALQDTIVDQQAAVSKADKDGTGFGVSPVTVADFTVQAVILDVLRFQFPNDRFIAEESSAQLLEAGESTTAEVVRQFAKWRRADPLPALAAASSDADRTRVCEALDLGTSGCADGWSATGRTWVLDPIDGTKGFLRGQQFCVALALLDQGSPVLGVLGCPNLGSERARPSPDADVETSPPGALFWAVQGRGAHARSLPVDAHEDARISVDRTRPADQLVRCESFERAHSSHGRSAQVADELGLSAPALRMDGQGKYGVLARGEGHVFMRLPRAGYIENVWDHAAGAIVIEEAGGLVTDSAGNKLDFSQGDKLSANVTGIVATCGGELHERILASLAANPDVDQA